MADDPREAQIRALINGRFHPSEHEGKPALARAWAEKAVAAVYRADPLPAPLADPEDVFRRVYRALLDEGRYVKPDEVRVVLAALRELGGPVTYDVTESLQIALREYLAEVGSSNESRACVLAEELERELGREVANGG